jgi:CheY-like chemotaxis protein
MRCFCHLSFVVSKSIVDLHDGDIWVDSALGEGSTFSFTVPLLPLPAPPPSPVECIPAVEAAATAGTMHTGTDLETAFSASTSNQGSSTASTASIVTSSNIELLTPTTSAALSSKFPLPHCLIVDDAPLNRKLIGRLIKPYFQQQSFAEDGQIALEFVANNMQNGDEKVSVIFMDSIMPVLSGIEATRQIRKFGYTGLILGVTGNVLDEQIADFYMVGANGVLAKPLDLHKAVQMLESKFVFICFSVGLLSIVHDEYFCCCRCCYHTNISCCVESYFDLIMLFTVSPCVPPHLPVPFIRLLQLSSKLQATTLSVRDGRVPVFKRKIVCTIVIAISFASVHCGNITTRSRCNFHDVVC